MNRERIENENALSLSHQDMASRRALPFLIEYFLNEMQTKSNILCYWDLCGDDRNGQYTLTLKWQRKRPYDRTGSEDDSRIIFNDAIHQIIRTNKGTQTEEHYQQIDSKLQRQNAKAKQIAEQISLFSFQDPIDERIVDSKDISDGFHQTCASINRFQVLRKLHRRPSKSEKHGSKCSKDLSNHIKVSELSDPWKLRNLSDS
ncbi:hypothetical protein GJ496_008422 [Pomphorhynchus laevis]|nr:hypothetical protein GJ496_008422 [Pomphorhynchus laevis]